MTMVNSDPVSHVDGQTLIDRVTFVDSGTAVRIAVSGGKVTDISKSNGPVEWVALPPLFDEHMHANRAFTLQSGRPKSFEDAVRMTLDMFAEYSADQFASRCRQLFETALRHGTTGVRTHADVDKDTKLRAVEGTLRAREEVREKMTVDVVAFASTRADPADAQTASMLREAVAQGCTYLGAVPVFYSDPRRSIDRLIELSMELDVDIDVHQDEHLDPGNSWSEYLADATIANDYHGRVCLSHGCALSALEGADQARVIEKLVAAQICVITLPLTNLYLQQRGAGTPRMRGVTAVQELLNAGVPVRIGSDNVCDAFFPYGDADLIGTAYVAMLVAHLEDMQSLVRGICAGRTNLKVGDRADMVLIKGSSFEEILTQRSAKRIILRQGEPLVL